MTAMMCFNTALTVMFLGHLLTDEAEAVSGAFKGLPENWVKGLVAVPEGRGGVTRNSKGSDVDL